MKIKNLTVESTPETILVVTKNGKAIAEHRQYWSNNSGTYGYQIASQSWFNLYEEDQELIEEKTGGCGYSKSQHAFISFLTKLFGNYRSYGGDVAYLLSSTKYHKGGNYYEIPLSVLNRMTKRK